MGYQERVAEVWKNEMSGKERRGFPLLTWNGAAELVNIFQPEIMGLEAYLTSNDPLSWLSQKPVEAVQPEFIKTKYYDLLGRVAQDVSVSSISKRQENYSADGYLLPEQAEAVYYDSKALAIHLDTLQGVETNTSLWGGIVWSTVKDTGAGLKKGVEKAAETGWSIGKGALVVGGVIGGIWLLSKLFGGRDE